MGKNLVALGWAALLVVVISCASARTANGAVTGRLPIAGSEVYANGVNLPWISYGNDIGGNGFGEYGFHDDVAKLDSDFSTMRSQGISTARVWLFADGRGGITFASNGLPTALDPEAFPDLDALTGAAAQSGVHLDLVLFDSQFMFAPQSLGLGVTSGGHGGLVNAGSGGQALEQVVVQPVLRHLAGNAAVFSIETMSEPEACIADDHDLTSRCTAAPVSLADFDAWTRMVAADVHADDPGVLVTVGSASSNWVRQYEGDGLDYYEVHSYNDSYAPGLTSTPASTLGLNAPVVVGEYPAAQAPAAFKTQLDDYFNEGYAGAWVWSFGDIDAVGTYDPATMTAWNAAHPATEVGAPVLPTPARAPEPVTQNDGIVDVFWHGASGAMMHSWFVPGAGWNGPVSMGGALLSDPSPVAQGGGALDVFYEGADRNLWHSWYQPGAWFGPGDLGMGPLGGEPHAVSPQTRVIDVFWRGTDNGLWHAWFAGAWYGPQELAAGGSLSSDPIPVSTGGGNIDVFWKNPTGGLSDITYRPASGWSSAAALSAGAVGSLSSAVSYGSGDQLVGWSGSDRNLWYATAGSGAPGVPASAGGGPLGSSPQFASPQAGQVAAFWAGTNGTAWYEHGTPGGSWSGPIPLPSGQIGSQPMPSSPSAGLLDVFWRGTNGGLWHAWGWNNAGWAGPQELAPPGSFAG